MGDEDNSVQNIREKKQQLNQLIIKTYYKNFDLIKLKDRISYVEWFNDLQLAFNEYLKKYQPLQYRLKFTSSFSKINNLSVCQPNQKAAAKHRYSCVDLKPQQQQQSNNNLSTRTTTAQKTVYFKRPTSKSLANVDDLLQMIVKNNHLKEKNPNILNILNNDINNNRVSSVSPNKNTNASSSVKYLKTIINKHRNSTSASNDNNQNGAVSTLALAAVSATALAEAATNTADQQPHQSTRRISRVLLLPQIINEKEKELNRRPSTTPPKQHHSSSSSSLFNLNTLKSHFHHKS